MAWETGTFLTTDEGELIAVFDVDLVANAKWSIFDAAAGTNCKVYRCYDAAENVDFYVKVDDNYTGYTVIELWEGWNAGTHTGVGSSLIDPNNYELRIWRPAGGWQMSVRNHRFVFINGNYCGTFIGQLARFDTSKNMPIYIGESTGSSKYNPLGYYNSSSNAAWWTLFDEIGSKNIINDYGQHNAYKFSKTIVGTFMVFETPIYNNNSKLLMGLLEGVMHLYSTPNGLSNGDIITVNGMEWVENGGEGTSKYWSLVEKA